MDIFLKEHLFADIFGRDVLSYQDREVATITALATLGGVEPMLKNHIGIALYLGMTEAQMEDLMTIVEAKVGRKEAEVGRRVLMGAMKK